MLTAKSAREQSNARLDEITKAKQDSAYDEIETLIKSAINKGKFEVTWRGYFDMVMAQRLDDLGYKCQDDEESTVIIIL